MKKSVLARWLAIVVAIVTLCGNGVCQKTASFSQVVKKAATQTAITTTASAINIGQSLQFSATVTPLKPTTPTGTVVFTATGTQAANTVTSSAMPVTSSGVEAWSVTLPAVDTYTVAAVYSGDSNYSTSTSSLSELVAAPQDFTITLPSSLTITKGQSATETIALTPLNGFTGAVKLSCSGMPYESSCGLSEGSVALSSSLINPALNKAATSAGNAPVSTVLTVTTSAITVTSAGAFLFLFGFGGMKRKRLMLLSLAGVGMLIAAIGISGCGAGSNRYVQNDGTPVGTYTVTVTATSGAITHTATTVLKVVAN
jgi:hypothetical protein